MKVTKNTQNAQNVKAETKTNAKVAAKEAAKELTEKKLTKRQITAAKNMNLAALEDDSSAKEFAIAVSRSYIKGAMLAKGYVMKNTVIIKNETGVVKVVMGIHYVGAIPCDVSDPRTLCTDKTFIGYILFAKAEDGIVYNEFPEWKDPVKGKEHWGKVIRLVKGIVHSHYCKDIFKWDEWKNKNKKAEDSFDVIER